MGFIAFQAFRPFAFQVCSLSFSFSFSIFFNSIKLLLVFFSLPLCFSFIFIIVNRHCRFDQQWARLYTLNPGPAIYIIFNSLAFGQPSEPSQPGWWPIGSITSSKTRRCRVAGLCKHCPGHRLNLRSIRHLSYIKVVFWLSASMYTRISECLNVVGSLLGWC